MHYIQLVPSTCIEQLYILTSQIERRFLYFSDRISDLGNNCYSRMCVHVLYVSRKFLAYVLSYSYLCLTCWNCVISWGPFCWKCVRIKSYTYTWTVQVLVNWSAGISYRHSRACPLIGSFLLKLLIVTAEKAKATEVSYLDACSLVTFLRGFILGQQGTCFCVWLWYKRERTSKHLAIWLILGVTLPRTNQIASCFNALSITYQLYNTRNCKELSFSVYLFIV
jgi:hypothetical protein